VAPDDLRFLSGVFLPCAPYRWAGRLLTHVHSPLTFRQLGKAGWALKPHVGAAEFAGEMIGHENDWSADPILSAYRAAVLPHLPRRVRVPRDWANRPHAAMVHQASGATYHHMCARYGVALRAIQDLALDLSKTSGLPRVRPDAFAREALRTDLEA
jgi:hypothetical protein